VVLVYYSCMDIQQKEYRNLTNLPLTILFSYETPLSLRGWTSFTMYKHSAKPLARN
jgi:hypothetical protein